jgi:hypothetical protein
MCDGAGAHSNKCFRNRAAEPVDEVCNLSVGVKTRVFLVPGLVL